MRIGFGLPVSGAWATPPNVTAVASGAEAAGYASLWAFQRLMVPAGSQLEPVYRSVLDPMLALSYAAAVTSRIRLGVAVINAPFVSPGYLAKQSATLDVLCGGRHDLGLGAGWMPEEFTLTGAAMGRRGARVAEYVSVLRAIWRTDGNGFSGEFYQVPPGSTAPAPVQPGGPPILLGGLAPAALQRAGRLADGWVTSSRTDLSAIADGIAVVRDAAARAGRDPDSVRIICRGVVRAGERATDPGTGTRLLLSGSPEQIRADAGWLAERGVTELFYDLNWDPLIGNPDVSADGAVRRGTELLQALAPTG